MKFRPSISGLMINVLLVAAVLGMMRSPELRPYAFYSWFGGLLLIGLADWIWFLYIPGKLGPAPGSDGVPRGRRLLKAIVATPSLLGAKAKILPRYLLFLRLESDGDHAGADEQARAVLKLDPPPIVEAVIRDQLADRLERQGRAAEAAEGRRKAEARLRDSRPDPTELMLRGRLLEKLGRHAEASEAFERGLATLPDSAEPAARVRFLMKLVISSFHAGRLTACVTRAEEAIAAGASGPMLRTAHVMAGLALGNLGRFDEAEPHRRCALELAEAAGDAAATARALAQIADLERRRGRLDEAEVTCRKARDIGAGDPEFRMTWCDVLRAQGRFEEALAMLEQAAADAPPSGPGAGDRVRALLALGMCWVEADWGRWEQAERRLLEARTALESDPKLGLIVEATAARVHAGIGRRDEARAHLARAEARLADLPDDRSTRVGTFGALGRAALLLDDLALADRLWTGFLEAGPDPVQLPLGFYHLGEARLGLGRVAEARDAFGRAVAAGVDTHHARLARERLDPGAVAGAGGVAAGPGPP